jgi:hypothetical protein
MRGPKLIAPAVALATALALTACNSLPGSRGPYSSSRTSASSPATAGSGNAGPGSTSTGCQGGAISAPGSNGGFSYLKAAQELATANAAAGQPGIDPCYAPALNDACRLLPAGDIQSTLGVAVVTPPRAGLNQTNDSWVAHCESPRADGSAGRVTVITEVYANVAAAQAGYQKGVRGTSDARTGVNDLGNLGDHSHLALYRNGQNEILFVKGDKIVDIHVDGLPYPHGPVTDLTRLANRALSRL